jgi:hypothetical protein
MADYDAIMQAYAYAKMVGDLFNVPANWFMSPIFITHLIVPLLLNFGFFYVMLTRKVVILHNKAVNAVLAAVLATGSIYAIVFNYMAVSMVMGVAIISLLKGFNIRSFIYMAIVVLALWWGLGFADTMIFKFFIM